MLRERLQLYCSPGFEVINNAVSTLRYKADARRAGGTVRNHVAMCMALLQIAQDVSST